MELLSSNGDLFSLSSSSKTFISFLATSLFSTYDSDLFMRIPNECSVKLLFMRTPNECSVQLQLQAEWLAKRNQAEWLVIGYSDEQMDIKLLDIKLFYVSDLDVQIDLLEALSSKTSSVLYFLIKVPVGSKFVWRRWTRGGFSTNGLIFYRCFIRYKFCMNFIFIDLAFLCTIIKFWLSCLLSVLSGIVIIIPYASVLGKWVVLFFGIVSDTTHTFPTNLANDTLLNLRVGVQVHSHACLLTVPIRMLVCLSACACRLVLLLVLTFYPFRNHNFSASQMSFRFPVRNMIHRASVVGESILPPLDFLCSSVKDNPESINEGRRLDGIPRKRHQAPHEPVLPADSFLRCRLRESSASLTFKETSVSLCCSYITAIVQRLCRPPLYKDVRFHYLLKESAEVLLVTNPGRALPSMRARIRRLL